MARRTRRERDPGRRPQAPPTPPIRPKPPTPTVTGRETRERRERRLRRTQRGVPEPTAGQELVDLLGRASEGFVEAFHLPQIPIRGRGGVPYSTAGFGGQTGDWRKVLAGVQQGLQPYGFGYGPTWGQPGGFLGGAGPGTQKTAAELAAIYSTAALGEPTQPWYMRDPSSGGRGGTAGRTLEIASAWAGGSLPQYVPKSVMGLMGDRISEQDMKDAGYRRTLGGGWQLEDTRPPLDVDDGSGGYGYGPYSYGAGRYSRPVAGGRSYGLVNWRIGL